MNRSGKTPLLQISRELRKTPIVTLVLCLLTLACTLPIQFGAVKEKTFEFGSVVRQYVIHDTGTGEYGVTRSYELWRPITSLFYAGRYFEFIIGLIMLHRLSMSLEIYHYPGRTIDYVWQIIVDACSITLVNNICFPTWAKWGFHPFLLSLLTVSAQIEPKAYVSFFGLFKLRMRNFPYLLLLFEHFVNGVPGSATSCIGFIVGWLWWLFVHTEMEKRRGTSFGVAPKWFRRLFGRRSVTIRGGRIIRDGKPSARRTNPIGREAVKDISGAHDWGSGFQLGRTTPAPSLDEQ